VLHGAFKNHASGSGHVKHREHIIKIYYFQIYIIFYKKILRNKSSKEDEEKYCANTG
jgi:hypothetical protein